MRYAQTAWMASMRSRLRTILAGPQLLAFLPAITLAAYWTGGEEALVGIALGMPIIFALAGLYTKEVGIAGGFRDTVTGLMIRQSAIDATDLLLGEGPTRGQTTAALAIEIDEFPELEKQFGHSACDGILRIVAARISGALRQSDIVARLDGPRFCVVLSSGARADLETLIQVATRLQRIIEAPCSLDGTRAFITISVGFCTPARAPTRSGTALIEAAEHALADAARTGTATIRAYSDEMGKRARAQGELNDELPGAIDSDQLRPWFQPQVTTETGELAGFEVLARWEHPDRGVLAPADFLPMLEQQGLLERLGEVMLYHSLNALRAWDAAGLNVPKISLNFSAEELRNPKIVDKIRWELDRFDLSPDRLSIEVLETVIAQTSSDMIIRNLRAFAELGCSVDLDDFGTGHASIANIKRFSVGRIKIDRSFITQIDSDIDQQNIVSAILTLADRLELQTLAEGVETAAERAVLAQLGCQYIQGYGIARPMPFEQVESWTLSSQPSAEATLIPSAGAPPGHTITTTPGNPGMTGKTA
ncbi:MAG: GGDEF domain-containing protein [Rhodobacteraceae bacterium]|nr:bifunctional diguanylate cyclase/phosphodiesterase [Alphaproteobacteria bacterium]NNK65336.1 GGDEF domain-containing protein [Paracoccaceae bacterium]